MKRRMLAVVACVVSAFALGSCGVIKSRTQVIVVVEADPGVRSQSSVVHVEVRGQANGTERGELVFDRRLDVGAREDVEFPLRVVMGPLAGDAERGWDLTATAQSGERPNLTDLVRVRATGTYVEGRTVTLTLRLEDCCTTIACSEQQTCRLSDIFSAPRPREREPGEP